MNDDINEDLKRKLVETLEAGLSDRAVAAFRKKIDGLIADVDDDITYRLKGDLAQNLAAYVSEMVVRTIEAILSGNEREVRRYLHCQTDGVYFTGRSTGYTGPNSPIGGQHPVIHGKLHEGQYIALRREMFEAHRELVVSERILDLEDQVRSLVAQVNKANADREAATDRWRAASGS